MEKDKTVNRKCGYPSTWKLVSIALIVLLSMFGIAAGIRVHAADGPEGKAPQGRRAQAVHDEHDGHDHEAHAAKEEPDDHEEHAEHEGHDGHEEHAEDEEHDDHEEHGLGEKHADDDGHDDHAGHDADEEEGLTLSPAERRNAGVVVATAGPGDLRSEISMPGEVALNEDRVAHVVPLVGGITREVRSTVGDEVDAGEVLAVLESSELGEAKLDYLTKINEILCCNILVPRAQAVHDNTLRLLAFLDGNPPLEKLQSFGAEDAGENLKTLISAYAELTFARQTHEREKGLHEKKISSEQDYLASKAQYEKAAAEYAAGRDSVAFEVKRDLLEAQAKLRAAKFEARTSEQRLRLMGIDEKEIHALDGLVLPEEKCNDPACKDCKAGASAGEREHYFGNGFARYEIRSPASGTVVEKHIVRGEKVGDDAEIFTIADTKTVWVNLTVYLKDLYAVRVGEQITVRAEHSGREARGRVAMVSPIVNAETRTATARLVLENDDGSWRPGVFVIGHVSVSAERVPVVVPKNALQTVEGKEVVFVPEGDRFKPVPVQTGRSDRERVEIVAGLPSGTEYVAEGAFELKAKLVTSSLGSHAGHGH